MKILHVCLAGPFSDGYSYQENLLTKFHARLGHEVFVITSTWSLNSEGSVTENFNNVYTNEDNVKVFRLKMKGRNKYKKKIKRYIGIDNILCEVKPNIIFIHGSQFIDVQPFIKYKKEKKDMIKIFVDNHADFSNSATNLLSREVLHKVIWKRTTLKLEPYVNKFYGVLPARETFLIDVYNVPKQKVSLLKMGGDDEFVNSYEKKHENIYKTKINLGWKDGQRVIITGGKIDKAKKEVLLLMEYVREKKDLFLIIFGSVEEDLKPAVNRLLSDNVKHIGWIDSKKSYEIFSIGDLVVFPGRHSVYWEQVVSQKKPLIVKYWEGTNHIDIGGNVIFVKYTFSEKEFLYEKLDEVLYTSKLNEMKNAAESNKSEDFLYSRIAKKSIE